MRSILLIFGVLAGLINTVMVGRYGFITSDSTIDGAIAAFYFSIIALGGIGGPAVAVHFASRRRWVWGLIFGLIAAVSLRATVVNSLGALAGRNDKTIAERIRARDDAREDKAQLSRIAAERAALVFVPTTAESVQAAREAVASAESIRMAECEKRGPRCRDREGEEQTKRDVFATVLAFKALTDKAARLDADAVTIRTRLDRAPLVQSIDPLADAIGKLVHLPSEVAAAWQKASVVIVVELLIASALIGFELEGRRLEAKPVDGMAQKRPLTIAGVQMNPPAENVVPMVPRQPKPAVIVGRHMLKRLARATGEEVPLATIYSDLCRWCAEQSIAPPSVAVFGQETRELFERHDIQTRVEGKVVVVVGVKLAA